MKVLFQPRFTGKDTSFRCFMKCDVDIRNKMSATVVLSGTASFQGTGGRRTKELTALTPPTMKVNVFASPECKYSVWIWRIYLVFFQVFSRCGPRRASLMNLALPSSTRSVVNSTHVSFRMSSKKRNLGSLTLTSSCQAHSYTSAGGNCVAHNCEQGCIELASTIAVTLGGLTVVNNDVGNDAEYLSTTEGVGWRQDASMDRGRQHDEGQRQCDVSDHRASDTTHLTTTIVNSL